MAEPPAEEKSLGNQLRRGGTSPSYGFKDDMEVFSPLMEVHPITPLDKLWNPIERESADKNPSLLLFPSSSRRFALSEEPANDLPIFDWKPGSILKQDDSLSSFTPLVSTHTASSETNDSSAVTPPEAQGGERLSNRFLHLGQQFSMPSHFGMTTSAGMTTGTMLSGLQFLSVSKGLANSTYNTSLSSASLHAPDNLSNHNLSNQVMLLGLSEHAPLSPISRITRQEDAESQGLHSLTLIQKFSTYAERLSTTSSFSDGMSLAVGSQKIKRTGPETRELLNSSLSRSNITETGTLPFVNEGVPQVPCVSAQPDLQQGSSFSLQLFQRTLDETLGTFEKSMHEDMRNLHIEILKQFHIQERDAFAALGLVLQNQAELMKEIQSLQEENQQLRQLLQH